jgi:hypothetical protein
MSVPSEVSGIQGANELHEWCIGPISTTPKSSVYI